MDALPPPMVSERPRHGAAGRAAKWLAILLGALVLIPLALVGVVVLALNTGVGQREAESLLASVLGDTVRVQGISGRVPDAPRLRHLELRDTDGVWLSADDIALDWSPTALLSGIAHVERLAIGHARIERTPVAATTVQAPTSNGKPFSLPVRVQVDAARIDQGEIGAALAGAEASVAVEAAATLDTLTTGEGHATIRRLGAEGTYALSAEVRESRLAAKLDATEPEGGLASNLAHLPALGALVVHATVDGPWDAARTDLAVAAGPLRAAARGQVNITGSAADLDVTASAPAMSPRSDIAWQSVALDAHVHGPFTKPAARGTLTARQVSAAGASIGDLDAHLDGDAGQVTLAATLGGLRIPGPRPDLLAAAPVAVQATARLDIPDRPVTFAITHPLAAIRGTATTGTAVAAHATIAAADLAPVAALGGIDLRGRADLVADLARAGDTTRATVDGTLGVTGGLAPIPGLIGPAARLGITASLTGGDVDLPRLHIEGSTLRADAHGGLAKGVVTLDWAVALSDLTALTPTVAGTLDGKGHVAGPTSDFAATAAVTGEVATKGFPRGPVTLAVDAKGLPAAPTGTVAAQGVLEGAPLALAAHASRAADGALDVTLDRATWKSAEASGAGTLAPGAKLPDGRVTLRVARLADLSTLAGQPLGGGLDLTAALDKQVATLTMNANNAGLPGSAAASAKLTARVTDPLGRPDVRANLAIDGLRAGATAGSVRLDLAGPEDALGLKLATNLDNFNGAPLAATTAGTLDVPKMQLAIGTLAATWKGETLRLLAPTRVSLAGGLSVERTRIGLRDAVLEVAGRISPTLDLTASLRNVSADLARIVAPDLQADGMLTADARITGTPARPGGTVRISANGLRLRTGQARALPAADLAATITLAGTSARVDTRLTAGRNQISVTGTAPLDPSGPLALRAVGDIDLAVADPILSAQGRRLRGRLSVDAGVAGTLAAPRPTGTIRLSDGEVQDFAQGARIDAIEALVEAAGDSVRISRFTGKAGQGTLSASGSIGVSGAMPIDLALTARGASPLASDRLTASLDADLSLRGAVRTGLAAGGTIRINSAEIRVPETLPTSVVTLNVRRPGDRPPPPVAPAPPVPVALNLILQAPGRIFVRGRGLDAELQGDLTVRGTTAAPLISGGFKLRRGTFSLVGQSLTFTTGEVTFDGSGRIDPTLNFVATSSSATVTANLAVTGYASAPKITLSSTPMLPQDEVLAQLLFHESASSLSPFQLAEIAAALAQISGVAGGGFDPLGKLRSGLGLDRLSVGGGTSGSSATVEAGRYVAQGVYVGAKQGTSGGGSQATVQIDITKGLKLETNVGAGGSTSTGASSSSDSGTNVGVTYQFEY